MTVSEARPVLISLDLARELHLMDRINGMDDRSGIVHLTEAELLASGASRVDWGQPDKHGWYTPTLFSQPTKETP
jgi:hypothetical protein